jgi:adenylate kinase family enzyme
VLGSEVKRVLVIGSGGAGKSTFARRLAERTGLPLVHLDALYWRPGWVEPAREVWDSTIADLLRGDRWILDGNYGRTMEVRIQASDTVVFLDVPRSVCLRRALLRSLTGRGRVRSDMAPGCPEQFTLSFLWWIWTYPKRRRTGVLERLASLRADQRAVVLRTDSDVEGFLASIPRANVSPS